MSGAVEGMSGAVEGISRPVEGISGAVEGISGADTSLNADWKAKSRVLEGLYADAVRFFA
jgi:hypothetical protein